MNKKVKSKFRILAIETSCDETSAAVLEVTTYKSLVMKINILSNIVSSQVKLHSKYGGVYPELASREHIKNILPVIQEAIFNSQFSIYNNKSNYKHQIINLLQNIDYIAVTTCPGLIGSLLVGTQTAKTLGYVFKKPVVLVNHLEGHIYANFVGVNMKLEISNPKQLHKINSKTINNLNKQGDLTTSTIPIFPLMALIVSGGHTSLVYMKDHLNYKIVGETLDDAAGEAYDKVASMLGLGYPGGPVIDKYAYEYLKKNSKHEILNSKIKKLNSNFGLCDTNYKLQKKLFPRPLLNANNNDFSFSGLKTSVLYFLKKYKKPYKKEFIKKVCYEFQEAVVETLVSKTIRVAKNYKVKSIVVSGGVAANFRLREEFEKAVSRQLPKTGLYLPDKKLCTDNAAMIGAVGAYKILAGKVNNWYDISASANAKLES